jgi:hypothetical protein
MAGTPVLISFLPSGPLHFDHHGQPPFADSGLLIRPAKTARPWRASTMFSSRFGTINRRGIPLNRPPGTFSPTGGEGRDERVRFMERNHPTAITALGRVQYEATVLAAYAGRAYDSEDAREDPNDVGDPDSYTRRDFSLSQRRRMTTIPSVSESKLLSVNLVTRSPPCP